MTTYRGRTRSFHVFCEVYGVNLFVVIGGTQDEMRAMLKKKFKIDPKDTYGEKTRSDLGGCVMDYDKWPYHVLWLGEKVSSDKRDFAPKLAHEVLHHTLRVCASKGIPTYPEIDNLIMDEPAAYLMEFYMREILKKLITKP